ncbi:hypothetical protein TREES_T100007893 [Tupaia chinensis]|uniref:Uncharacterized protein n=1 Tax=Tupaia chinensis TaxID=246437 RepID=L9JHC9_TUPCH|nr:hypothetical protein TREES_T100007893 [Tupaia chinensis]
MDKATFRLRNGKDKAAEDTARSYGNLLSASGVLCTEEAALDGVDMCRRCHYTSPCSGQLASGSAEPTHSPMSPMPGARWPFPQPRLRGANASSKETGYEE